MRLISRLESATELGLYRAFVEQAAQAARSSGLGPQRVADVELAVEEAFTNVCKYAGGKDIRPAGTCGTSDSAGAGAPGRAALRCLADDELFAVELSDDGQPFDPTLQPDPELGVDPAERPIGGLGILLIKKVSDAVRYRREGGRNILRMEFRRPGPRP